MLLDTCHAGEPDREDPQLAAVRIVAGQRVRSIQLQPVVAPGVNAAALNITDLLERHFVDLRIGAGAAVLASSTARQQSLETDEVSNGLFTAAILQGIKQGKADLDGDGTVRVSELIHYCKEQVSVLSEGAQDPVARHLNLAEDFAVVKYR